MTIHDITRLIVLLTFLFTSEKGKVMNEVNHLPFLLGKGGLLILKFRVAAAVPVVAAAAPVIVW